MAAAEKDDGPTEVGEPAGGLCPPGGHASGLSNALREAGLDWDTVGAAAAEHHGAVWNIVMPFDLDAWAAAPRGGHRLPGWVFEKDLGAFFYGHRQEGQQLRDNFLASFEHKVSNWQAAQPMDPPRSTRMLSAGDGGVCLHKG